MNNEKEDMFFAFLLDFLTGIALFSAIDRKKERRIAKFNKIKDELYNGFTLDKKNLSNDWQHIYYDLDKSFKKLKHDTHYETV